MNISLAPLEKSLASLARDLRFATEALHDQDDERYLSHRTAAIHSFQVAFELSVRMLQRVMQALGETRLAGLSYKETMRRAADRLLLPENSLVQWLRFCEIRNEVTHEYGEDMAEHTYQQLHPFLSGAEALRQHLAERIATLDA